jgi:hypothetical protein
VFLFDWPGFRPAVGARLQPFSKGILFHLIF